MKTVRVWAPDAENVDLLVCEPDPNRQHSSGRGLNPIDSMPMQRVGTRGYWEVAMPAEILAESGAPTPRWGYMIQVDGKHPVPAPDAQRLPWGWDGPGVLTSPSIATPLDRAQLPQSVGRLIWEGHVGTATPEGTFAALIGLLPELRDRGFTTVQLMPVTPTPGERNWGYDPTGFGAANESYGGPEGLDALIDAAHRLGLEVTLDSEYNHMGPEQALWPFPSFFAAADTPWGGALDFKNPEVRQFFINNALYWLFERHVDGLRLDAAHEYRPAEYGEIFLKELDAAIREKEAETGTKKWIIAEVDAPDAALWAQPTRESGRGLDAVIVDEVAHAFATAMSRQPRVAWLADFGDLASIAAALLAAGHVYTGQHSAFRGKAHGVPYDSSEIPADTSVGHVGTHDHTGNRPFGDRLSTRISHDQYLLVTAILSLSMRNRLVFMGDEYGTRIPFQFFTDFLPGSDVSVGCKIGRALEFIDFSKIYGYTPPTDLTKAEVEAFVWEHMTDRVRVMQKSV